MVRMAVFNKTFEYDFCVETGDRINPVVHGINEDRGLIYEDAVQLMNKLIASGMDDARVRIHQLSEV